MEEIIQYFAEVCYERFMEEQEKIFRNPKGFSDFEKGVTEAVNRLGREFIRLTLEEMNRCFKDSSWRRDKWYVQDTDGNDITPSLDEFLSNGSARQPIVTVGDGFKDVVQKAGLVAIRKMNAKEMLEYHRNHWTIENSLHYVLDETFGEDKCTVRKGKNALSMLRKCAYNIARLLQNKNPKERPYIPDVLDDIADQFELAAGYIFKAVPAF